jgi:hypothetical protein
MVLNTVMTEQPKMTTVMTMQEWAEGVCAIHSARHALASRKGPPPDVALAIVAELDRLDHLLRRAS